MRILEVRDGFIKFEAIDVLLSAFIQVDDTTNSYIAQVMQVKRAGEKFIAYAKILFLYNGAFNKYDNSLPSLDAVVKDFDFTQFNTTFNSSNTISVGNFIKNNEPINIDKNSLNKKTLICFDTNEANRIVISNLAKQFEKSIIIDTKGVFESSKFVAGVDFKLPLNTEALRFLYEDCLNDATSDSKNLIKEIFQDLSNYSKTVPFLPFGSLKTIIDEMVDKSYVFKLLVLKNKLAKFDKLGYFAATNIEAENLKNILNTKNAIIDLSKLDTIFQNRYLEIILLTIEKINPSAQVFVNVSNTLDKKNLKTILKGNLSTTLVTHSRFKYINEIKPMFANYIIEPSFTSKEIFKAYSIFLNSMRKDTYLVVGEGTQYIPFVSNLLEYSEPIVERVENNLLDAEIVDLEEALEQDSQKLVEEDESINVIEKKSKDLIEKVSQEVSSENMPEELELFEEDDNESEPDIASEGKIETEEDIIDLKESDLEEVHLEESDFSLETVDDNDVEVNEIETEIEQIEETTLADVESVGENLIQEEYHTHVDEIQTIEIPEDISELADECENLDINSQEELLVQGTTESEDSTWQEDDSVVSSLTIEENTPKEIALRDYSEELDEVQTIQDDISVSNELEQFDDIIELADDDEVDADIIVEFDDENENQLDEQQLDKAIVEDVDKVFTTIKEDSISDSDLDFIDELNNSVEDDIEPITLPEGMEELSDLQEIEENDDGFLEPLEEVSNFEQQEENDEKEILEKRNASTPIVPVYGAEIPSEDMVMSDDIEQGDTVVHAKYGNGVVEKMIKYGTKTLYSINFDNVGRRLLDPTLTEIKKS